VADLRKVIEEIVREELEKIIQEAPLAGPRKKVLRRVGGQLKVVKKRKKKLPLHLRLVKPSQAKRIARKAATSSYYKES
jgi:hypothetical protein